MGNKQGGQAKEGGSANGKGGIISKEVSPSKSKSTSDVLANVEVKEEAVRTRAVSDGSETAEEQGVGAPSTV